MSGGAVADTTVWSNLAHAGDPRLPQRVFTGIASPPAVLEKLRAVDLGVSRLFRNRVTG